MLKKIKHFDFLDWLVIGVGLIAGFVFLFLALTAVFDLGRVPSASPLERQYNAYISYRNESDRAKQRLAAHSNGKEPYSERAADEYKASSQRTFKDFEDKYADVTAQEGMWRAAEYLVFLTFAQAVFFAVSLIWLKRTFDANNRAAKAAENAERAHLYGSAEIDFQRILMGPPTGDGSYAQYINKRKLSVKFSVRNYGRTPARNIVCRMNIFKGVGVRVPDTVRQIDILVESEKGEFVYEGLADTALALTQTGSGFPVGNMRIEYSDVFGRERNPANSMFMAKLFGPHGQVTIADNAVHNRQLVSTVIGALREARVQAHHESHY